MASSYPTLTEHYEYPTGQSDYRHPRLHFFQIRLYDILLNLFKSTVSKSQTIGTCPDPCRPHSTTKWSKVTDHPIWNIFMTFFLASPSFLTHHRFYWSFWTVGMPTLSYPVFVSRLLAIGLLFYSRKSAICILDFDGAHYLRGTLTVFLNHSILCLGTHACCEREASWSVRTVCGLRWPCTLL